MNKIKVESHTKIYGDAPSVSVSVRVVDNILCFENKIQVNWSCCGAVSIDEAMEFNNNLSEALGYARAIRNQIDDGSK